MDAVGAPLGTSSSVTVTATDLVDNPEDEHAIVALSFDVSASWAAETVTVWGELQLDGVKVREPGDAVTSASPTERPTETTTFAAGAIASRTVKVPVAPSRT